jgi:hypothetical protein
MALPDHKIRSNTQMASTMTVLGLSSVVRINLVYSATITNARAALSHQLQAESYHGRFFCDMPSLYILLTCHISFIEAGKWLQVAEVISSKIHEPENPKCPPRSECRFQWHNGREFRNGSLGAKTYRNQPSSDSRRIAEVG